MLTMTPERPAERSHYFRGEDEVLEAGLPVPLLHEEGEVTGEVQQTASPFVVPLDRDRRVRAEGEPPSVHLSNALAAASA